MDIISDILVGKILEEELLEHVTSNDISVAIAVA